VGTSPIFWWLCGKFVGIIPVYLLIVYSGGSNQGANLTMAQPYKTSSFVAGAKAALNHRGYDDFMVYYTLLSMGIPTSAIDHIGKAEREKREELSGIKANKKDN
jgi:hypothetical protein